MSYAGPSRARGSAASRATPAGRTSPARRAAAGAASAHETDWGQVAIFSTGLALGIAVGAAAAMLTAPRSGAETRAVLRAQAGRVQRSSTRRGRVAWDDLRDEIRGVTRALRRRKVQRAAERDLRREVVLEDTMD